MNPIIITNNKRTLNIYLRTEEGTLKKIVETNFFPYFYVEDPKGIYRTFDCKKARKVIAKIPQEVRRKREEFRERGLNVYEADVPYVVRYAIDRYETPWPKTPIRFCYFDIEVQDSLDYINAPKPIVSITVFDNFKSEYYVFVLSQEDRIHKIKDGFILEFRDEASMLNKFISFIQKRDPDLLVAWNVKYDINYLINRMKNLGIKYQKLSRENKVTFIENLVHEIKGRVVLDLMDLYKKLKAKSLESYSLEYVAEYEGLPVRKLKRREIAEMSKWELIAYNKRDVELLVLLDRKLGIIEFWDELRRFVGLPWNVFYDLKLGISNKRLVDTYLLRKAKKKGLVLPSTEEREAKHYEGALVLEPPVGVFKNVVVLDVKSMYPNIIRTYNLSPETLDDNGEILTPIGYRFRKEPFGLVPEACSELFELRKQYKKKMKEYLNQGIEDKFKEFDAKQRAVKIVLNSMYGVMAYPKFRLFRQEVAESVTAFGRELIQHIIRVVENQGYKVLYGDTDSVFVKFPDEWNKEKCLEKANGLVQIINESFEEFTRRWKVDKHYHEIELKFVFDRIAFFGVKKRYVGYFVNEEGTWKEGLEIKGVEVIRSDSAEITKETFKRVLEMLLIENRTPEEILEYIKEIKKKIKLGEIPTEKLVFKVSFDPGKEYKQKNTPFLRGLRFAISQGLIDTMPSGKVVWIWIRHPESDVIALPEAKIHLIKNYLLDYNRCEERWFGNLEKLLKKLIPDQMTLQSFSFSKNSMSG